MFTRCFDIPGEMPKDLVTVFFRTKSYLWDLDNAELRDLRTEFHITCLCAQALHLLAQLLPRHINMKAVKPITSNSVFLKTVAEFLCHFTISHRSVNYNYLFLILSFRRVLYVMC